MPWKNEPVLFSADFATLSESKVTENSIKTKQNNKQKQEEQMLEQSIFITLTRLLYSHIS